MAINIHDLWKQVQTKHPNPNPRHRAWGARSILSIDYYKDKEWKDYWFMDTNLRNYFNASPAFDKIKLITQCRPKHSHNIQIPECVNPNDHSKRLDFDACDGSLIPSCGIELEHEADEEDVDLTPPPPPPPSSL